MAAGLSALAGCATLDPDVYTMRFTSEPSGALIYTASGKAIGMTPMERLVRLTPQQRAMDKMEDTAIAVWPSGATLRRSVVIRPKEFKVWNVPFSRPAQAAGVDVDLRHALAQQRQLQAQHEADVSNLLGAFVGAYNAGRYQAAPVPLESPSSIRCTSREVGWSIVTDCR